MEPMTKEQLLVVSKSGQSMPGPTWRRVDCLVRGLEPPIEVWGALVEFGPRYTLESLHASLAGAGNPPLFHSEAEAVDWLVQAINASPEAPRLRDRLDTVAAEELAKSEARRAEELARAQAIVEKAAKRLQDTESS